MSARATETVAAVLLVAGVLAWYWYVKKGQYLGGPSLMQMNDPRRPGFNPSGAPASPAYTGTGVQGDYQYG